MPKAAHLRAHWAGQRGPSASHPRGSCAMCVGRACCRRSRNPRSQDNAKAPKQRLQIWGRCP
eukprot:4170330-Alexandrium_andersonii.AAC.1